LLRLRLSSGYDLIFLVYPPVVSKQPGSVEFQGSIEVPKTRIVLSDKIKQLEYLFTKAGLLSLLI
jgi:hypothetical protein